MANPSSVLLGRNSSITGLGFSAGYLRTWSISQTLDTIDVSGVGDTNELVSGIPVRYRAVAFGDFTGSATGMIASGGGGAPAIGSSITVQGDAMTSPLGAVVSEVTEDGSYDGLVELSISFESNGT